MDLLRGAALVAATMTTGLVAGVFDLYAHTIMPGLRRTDDRTFVAAFQSIDTVIINPGFPASFIGALLLTGLAAALHLGADNRSVLPSWQASAPRAADRDSGSCAHGTRHESHHGGRSSRTAARRRGRWQSAPRLLGAHRYRRGYRPGSGRKRPVQRRRRSTYRRSWRSAGRASGPQTARRTAAACSWPRPGPGP